MPRKKAKPKAELGYAEPVEPCDEHYLAPHFFPSKIGGRPAWLTHDPVPGPIICGVCAGPMVFMLQVYAPLSPPSKGASDETFHRTIFVFVCPEPECCQPSKTSNFKVLRSQCARKNEFYPSEPLDPETVTENLLAQKIQGLSLLEKLDLCVICGAKADRKCDNCDGEGYCTEKHKELHWKKLHHHECGKTPSEIESLAKQRDKVRKNKNPPKSQDFGILFPLFELETEPEDYTPGKDEERPEKERLADFSKFVQDSGLGDAESSGCVASNSDDPELDEFKANLDRFFKNFTRRVAANPEQILRYDRAAGQGPLWATPEAPPDPVPPCGVCGGPRVFEFQIMPHLLSVLGVDSVGKSIDFATLAVFTCERSCEIDASKGYVEEYVWKQDFSE